MLPLPTISHVSSPRVTHRLDNILYSLKVGEETEGDVLGIVQQLQGQSLFYRQQLEGLRLKISAKAEVYEFDLEVLLP